MKIDDLLERMIEDGGEEDSYVEKVRHAYEGYEETLKQYDHEILALKTFARRMEYPHEKTRVSPLNRRILLERFGSAEARALADYLGSCPSVKRTYRLKQSEVIERLGLKNKPGICCCMTMDWLRRKSWNSAVLNRNDERTGGKVSLNSGAKFDHRMRTIDRLQSKRRNIGGSVLADLDAIKRGIKEKASRVTFSDAMQIGAKKKAGFGHDESVEVIDSEIQRIVNELLSRVEGEACGLYVGVEEIVSRGHAFGAFQMEPQVVGKRHPSMMTRYLFDPNYGEYWWYGERSLADLISRWYLIHYAWGMRRFEATLFTPR